MVYLHQEDKQLNKYDMWCIANTLTVAAPPCEFLWWNIQNIEVFMKDLEAAWKEADYGSAAMARCIQL